MHCKVFSNVSCLYLPAETFLPGCDNQKCISLLSNVASFLQYCLRSLKVVFCITFIEFYSHLEAIRSICCSQQFLLFLCDTAKAPAANAQCLYPTECFCLNNSFFCLQNLFSRMLIVTTLKWQIKSLMRSNYKNKLKQKQSVNIKL